MKLHEATVIGTCTVGIIKYRLVRGPDNNKNEKFWLERAIKDATGTPSWIPVNDWKGRDYHDDVPGDKTSVEYDATIAIICALSGNPNE